MFQTSKVLPYPAHFLKDIVANVEQYPLFLPMLKAVTIYPQSPNFFEADLTIGKGPLEKTYRSEVFIFDDAVQAEAKPDSTFKFLESRWHFVPYNGNTIVHFTLNFQLKSALLQMTIGKLLDNTAQTMISAFEERAQQLWSCSPPLARPENP